MVAMEIEKEAAAAGKAVAEAFRKIAVEER
jgi:hypothetical protein